MVFKRKKNLSSFPFFFFFFFVFVGPIALMGKGLLHGGFESGWPPPSCQGKFHRRHVGRSHRPWLKSQHEN